MSESELLAAIRAAPGDDGPIHAYAEWLLSRGDARGELILLDRRERAGSLLTLTELDRLLALAAEHHGFPKLPDDPCAGILPFEGGGAYPTQYSLIHEGHDYYLRWRYGFSIDVDDIEVFEGHLDTLTTNEWTFCETNVILAIVSAAITSGQPLSELVFPDNAGIRAHPRFHPGRSPFLVVPDGLHDPKRWLELRDFPRWRRLWERRQRLVGIEPPPPIRELRCACGVEGLSCGVEGCDIPQK